MAKKGPDQLYPIGIRGNPTGNAVRATCWSIASKKLAKYQRVYGSNYYLMTPVPYVENAGKYIEFDIPKQKPAVVPRTRAEKREINLKRHDSMMKGLHLD